MTTEEKLGDYKIEVEEYQEDFKLLLRIKDIAEHLHYKTTQQRRFSSGDPDMEIMLEEIIKNADEAIIHLVKEFADIYADIQPSEAEYTIKAGKLGYAFTWLMKLDGAADDNEREQILKDWLKEISEKKSAKND